MSSALDGLRTKLGRRGLAIGVLALAALFPLLFDPLATQMDVAIFVLAYVMMALGLNIVVGFAGLLDLGYVAFYAIGAYTVGWLASDHFSGVGGEGGIHVLVSKFVHTSDGIHVNFFLVLFAAVIVASVLGAVIGLPTLRLRGDYIAIVTLAFGEIIGRIALNGDEITFGHYHLTAGQQAISPVDQPFIPFAGYEFDSAFNLRPYYWTGLVLLCFTLFVNFRLRDSRLGRAWIALREDEVAAASMGVPLVRTKLLAYAAGAGLGGIAGAFLGSYNNAINSNQFQFSFSIFVLAMVILGGMGSIWGVTAGAFALALIDRYLIPEVFDDLPSKVGLDFQLTQLSFGIFGFLLVLIMVLRPEGLFPERRRQIELTEGVGTDESVFEARA
ncbi:MAG: branched-chain amino acid transport system permease protein [Solirubrobacteraceae bacterium]|nr:branched-chain amino acid transport system permease protein [Solirubrobacteraceae bacterium]